MRKPFLSRHQLIDFSLLKSAVHLADIEAYRRRHDKNPIALAHVMGASIIISVVSVIVPLIFAAAVPVAQVVGGFVLLAIVYAAAIYFATKRHVRLDRLATSAGLMYAPEGASLAGAGAIFRVGRHRRIYEVFYQVNESGERMFEFGKCRYTIGFGRSARTYCWQFACIKMNRNLPHMILDATSNNQKVLGMELSDLPVSLPRRQRIQLEGNFNDYFTLYAPEKYDVDARYILTPDLMALLIDTAAAYNVEVMDDTVYFYARAEAATDEMIVKSILEIIDTVGNKLYRQTDAYVDDRAVARGRRLSV